MTPYMDRRTKTWPDGQLNDPTMVALDATDDEVKWAPGKPIDVVRWGFIITTALDVGAGFGAALDLRPTVGSDTDRVNGDSSGTTDTGGGTITATADVAVGAGLYHNVDPPLEVDPGEELVLQITDAADTSGAGYFFVEYEERPFVGDSNVTAGDPSNRIDNMTEYTS